MNAGHDGDLGGPHSDLSAEDRGVVAALERYGRAGSDQVSPWPGLDGAIRHDRRVRGAQRAAGAVAAALAAALVLPFTPVRVEPLDQLAAAIGLRDRADGSTREEKPPQGLSQDVRPGDGDYRDLTGDPLPSLAEGRIRDAAWLYAAEMRASWIVMPEGAALDANGEVTALWAGDDGFRTRAVVGFSSSGDAIRAWAVLSGPSGSSPDDLDVASLSDYLQPAEPFAPDADRGLVADYRPGDTSATRLAGYPSVDAAGTVTTVWHEASQVMPGLWLGDLGQEGRRGWIVSTVGDADSDIEARQPGYGNRPASAPEPGSPEEFLSTSPLGSFQDLGYAGASRELSLGGYGGVDDAAGETRADVRIVGVRSPGGGWLVSGDATATGFLGSGESVTFEKIGSRAKLEVVAAPATPSQTTPMVGLIAPRDNGDPTGYVIVWAPPQVKTVRSGDVSAPVVNGLALLDLRQGRGKRISQGEVDQAVLIEGLDADGKVSGRSRVNERDYTKWSPVDDETGKRVRRAGPHDATSRVVMPTIRWP